jgi:hypothetical protein
MDTPLDPDKTGVTDQLHPLIYTALAGSAACLALAAWIFFSRSGYVELDLGVVSVLFFMLIAIPSALFMIRRAFGSSDPVHGGASRFRDWISSDFEVSQGRQKGIAASIEILLPMTAAVLGITAIGIVFDLTATGGYWH